MSSSILPNEHSPKAIVLTLSVSDSLDTWPSLAACNGEERPMGVKIRQKDDKWYVLINHQGQRKAKCVAA